MSDVPQDVGWWQASDGKWYPPAAFPTGPPAPPAPAPPAQPAPGWWLASDGRWYPPPGYAGQPGYPAMVPAPVVYVVPYKSKALAAVFAFVFCGWGIHHFYLGRVGAGVAQACMLFFGAILSGLLIGIPFLLAALIWSFVDGINIVSGNVRDASGQPLV